MTVKSEVVPVLMAAAPWQERIFIFVQILKQHHF